MSTPDETRRYYDRHADVYDRKTGFGRLGGQDYNLEHYYEPLLSGVLPPSGDILELGCGTGFYTRWLAERGLHVTALDISAEMIERARVRCPEDVSLHVADCEDPATALAPEVARAGFDVIVGVNTFSYYAHKADALKRYRQLLREGGCLVMIDMNGLSLTQQLAYLFNYRGARRFARNVNESVPARLNPMLEASGFRVERMERFTFVPNEVSGALGALFQAADRILMRVPLARIFAFRLFWVARAV
jgi:SAM-dependent methyltransferase